MTTSSKISICHVTSVEESSVTFLLAERSLWSCSPAWAYLLAVRRTRGARGSRLRRASVSPPPWSTVLLLGRLGASRGNAGLWRAPCLPRDAPPLSWDVQWTRPVGMGRRLLRLLTPMLTAPLVLLGCSVLWDVPLVIRWVPPLVLWGSAGEEPCHGPQQLDCLVHLSGQFPAVQRSFPVTCYCRGR